LIRDDVAAARWCDEDTPIRGPLAAWRACFPCAVAANVSGRRDLRDADFAHLAGVKALNMNSCHKITEAGFAHQTGIRELRVYGCSRATIAAASALELPGWGGLGVRLAEAGHHEPFNFKRYLHLYYIVEWVQGAQ
jgi:hypothetical protein